MVSLAKIKEENFSDQMESNGWFLFPEFMPHNLVLKMLDDIERAYDFCRSIQIKNGVENSEGTLHHLVGVRPSFLDCLAEFERLDPYLMEYFGGKYILNSFGGNILKRGMSYANNIHRDQRSFSGEFPLMLNSIVMLDEFTADNGATWIMRGGHKLKDRPEQSVFDMYKIQAIAPAGSILIFNSNMWHQAGSNKTEFSRRSVTPIFSRPFMKQGYDYCRALPSSSYGEYLKQVLGYYSRVPTTLHEWYKPKDERFYREGQG